MSQEDALLTVCRAVLDDPFVVPDDDWDKILVGCELAPGCSGLWGYRFDPAGSCVAVSPRHSHVPFRDLRNAMACENHRVWVACLLRIGHDGSVGVDFEYSDADRWRVSPTNYAARIAQYAAMPVSGYARA